MTYNAAQQSNVDRLKDGAASLLTPKQLALLGQAIADGAKRPDFDYEASIASATIDDTAVNAVNAQGSTEVAAAEASRAALQTSANDLRTAVNKTRIGRFYHSQYVRNWGPTDPYRHDQQLTYYIPQWMGYDEVTDRLYFNRWEQLYNPGTHISPSRAYPEFCMYDFTTGKFTTLIQASSDAISYNGIEHWHNNPNYCFPVLLAKSDDPTSLRWCLFHVGLNSGASRFFYPSIFAYDEGQYHTIKKYSLPLAHNSFAHRWMYDVTNKCLIGALGNSTDVRKLYWDKYTHDTLGSVFDTFFTTPTAQYLDIFQNTQSRSRPANRGPLWNFAGQNSAAPFNLVSLWSSPYHERNPSGVGNHTGLTSYGQFGGYYQGITTAQSWLYRKADNTVEMRHAAVSQFNQEREWLDQGATGWRWIYRPTEKFRFMVYDTEHKPVRGGNLFVPIQSSYNVAAPDTVDDMPSILRVQPMFYHPTRDELVAYVTRNGHAVHTVAVSHHTRLENFRC